MRLIELLKNIEICEKVGEVNDIEIENISYDSRIIKENCAFVCLRGDNTDGHYYISSAIDNGAKVIICEEKSDLKILQVIVRNTRNALALMCSNFYKTPCEKLKIIAVVGTNGKTTTTFLIRSILENAGKKVGLIGTQGVYIGNQFIPTDMTTPDPQVLHKVLNDMVNAQIEYVVMEASAHALALDKLDGIIFEVVVFTNFTQDHLDYFKTMENYKKAKLKIFNRKRIRSAVLNFDDKVGLEIAGMLDVPIISYALYYPSDIFAVDICNTNTKSEYVVNLLDNIFFIKSNLLGEFNIYNSLAAASACSMLGCSEKNIKNGLESLLSVPGRLNAIVLNTGATAIIDFAHTPDGIEKVLTAIKGLHFKKIITVFGCGGNRDKGKRSQMGKIAENLSDYVIVSSDNPRFENPELIIDDIENGMKKTAHTRIVDRKKAIEFAIEMAKSKEVIVICGKGAEEYQDINGVKSPYNDYEVVLNKNEEIKIKNSVIGE